MKGRERDPVELERLFLLLDREVDTHWVSYDQEGRFYFERIEKLDDDGHADGPIERYVAKKFGVKAWTSAANKPEGKPRPTLVDSDFIMAMAQLMELGIKNGRNRDDWKRVERDQALEEYRDAMERHVLGYGDEPELAHVVAVACNAMILWWHLKEQDDGS